MDTVFYCKILPKKKRIRTLVFTSGPPYHLTGPRNFGVFLGFSQKKRKGMSDGLAKTLNYAFG